MTRKLALFLVTALMVATSATPTLAAPPTAAEGDWTYVPDDPVVRIAGQNVFLSNTDTGTFTGTPEGTSTEDFVVVLHQVVVGGPFGFECAHPSEKCHGIYQGLVTFTGTVDGKAGTLRIKTNGSGPWPPVETWSGSWVILSGTGELSNLRGQGSWWGPLLTLEYDGKVHFTG